MANPLGVNQHSNGAHSNRHQVHVTNRTAKTVSNKDIVTPPPAIVTPKKDETP